MNRTEYRNARRLIRANGLYALRWLPEAQAHTMRQLADIQGQVNELGERAILARIPAYKARGAIFATVSPAIYGRYVRSLR